ncbi:hypothetical protein DMA12_35210 [Amycolatopsis balhimycina DSM 5908]|uniref:ATP/GTP-binding protein n=2 Tax=Amycolatopsis balhimycina TaxID=208443 RepID=A0A428W495_AMYBA|nr:hypothetical protein DMA12_35210 [Amycolatopsis balhimycina DSM 5908]
MRAPVVGGVVVAMLLASAAEAMAGGWGSVDCAQESSPYCDLGAGRNGGRAPQPPVAPGKPARPQPMPGQQQPWGDSIIGGNDTTAKCSYVRSNYQPPANGVQTIVFRDVRRNGASVVFAEFRRQQPAGAWYVYRCSGPGVHDGLYRVPIWLPDGQVPAAAASPSPQELADQARAQLRLPTPRIEANPPGDKLVSLSTWMWLDRSSWDTRQATVAVPGVSVTAVAVPAMVSWSMGDGEDVTCSGPGTPYPAAGDPRAPSPDCGHTYRRSSAAAPGQHFAVKATVHWTVTWSGAGASGTFPDLTTSATAAFRVAEVQALGTGHR